MTLETMQAVVEDLKQRGIEATLEYPGSIEAHPTADLVLVGGDANETFGIDQCDYEHNVLDSEWFASTIPSDSTDVQAIANHFACAYYEAKESS